MSSTSVDQEPKIVEEPPREQRSLREQLVDQVRRLVPPRCNTITPQAGTSAGGTSDSPTPKVPSGRCSSQTSEPKVPSARCSSQSSEPNVTVLHVRASVQRTTPISHHRPPDFSEQDSEMEITISPPPGPPKVIYGPPPLAGAPPSYSAIMRLGTYDLLSSNRRRGITLQPSPPFVAPAPPPSYAEAEGFYAELEVASAEQMGFGAQSTAAVCTNCGTFVMTTIQRRSSNVTHFSAFILFLCGCWPCCLIPYCLDTCKVVHHYCPGCHQLLGIYRPW